MDDSILFALVTDVAGVLTLVLRICLLILSIDYRRVGAASTIFRSTQLTIVGDPCRLSVLVPLGFALPAAVVTNCFTRFVGLLPGDLSGMSGPTRNISSCQHSSLRQGGTQTT